jgi:hypothetical protein
MANLINPSGVQVVTKDGEMTVNLKIDLNINLNGTAVNIPINETAKVKSMDEDDKVEWMVPDFTSSKKINFGK